MSICTGIHGSPSTRRFTVRPKKLTCKITKVDLLRPLENKNIHPKVAEIFQSGPKDQVTQSSLEQCR